MKNAMFVMFLAVLVACPVSALLPDASANGVKDGPRPGEKNPVTPNRNSLFCDDELLMLVGYPGDHKVGYTSLVPTSADLTDWSEETHTHTFLSSEYGLVHDNAPPWAVASGRITNALHDQVAYAFYRPDGKVQVELWDYPDRLTHYVTLEGTTGTYQSVDVAVGDLDLVVDDKGYYHDEIVVARTTGDSVQVDVLDQNLHSLASASVPANHGAHTLAVAIGDFDGGENLEFAVAQMGRSTEYQIDVFRCLEKATTYTKNIECGCKRIDMAAGDFNGDGTDEIAVFAGGDDCGCSCSFHFLDVDQDLNLHLKHTWAPGNVPDDLKIISGLFKYDPDNGYGITRRQVAAYAYYGNNIYYYTIYLDDDLKPHVMGRYTVEADQAQTGVPIGLSAGNFVGHQDENKSPLMDIAISYLETYCDEGDIFNCTSWARVPKLEILTPSLENKYTWTGSKHTAQYTSDLPIMPTAVVAYDKDGDTYRLGPPVHITIENLLGLDYVVQEPPKHVDYLPKNPDDPEDEWNWDVINVSAWPEFYVEFKYKLETIVSTKTTATSSWDIGGSAELKVKGTVKAGVGDIAKASVSEESKTKIGYDYKSSESSYNSDYHSRSVSYASQTNTDDYLYGKIQLMDIWRYPVYGCNTTDEDNPYGFQEITLPGPELPFGSGGRDHADWYQPIHQNRNVLSYPNSQKGEWLPSDLGSFKLPDDTNVTDIMNEGAIRDWDGNEQDIYVKWTDKAGLDSAKTYNHTLSESEDITIGTSAKASFVEGSAEVDTSVKLGFNNSNSWGGSTTEDTTNSKSTGIHIHIPHGTGSEAYALKSAIYVSSGGGAYKVAHATDPTGSDQGAGWWKSQYGRKPDPALNLPNRFEWHVDGSVKYWTLIEEDSRKRMRGFFLRDSEKNKVSGEYNLLGEMLTDGDVVRVCARVYNFSISKTPGDFDVRFEYVPFDTENHKEVGARVLIGDASVLPLDPQYPLGPRGMQEVYFEWDTTGLSNMSAGDSYRLYVTLDPDDEVVDEIHEWKDAQGNLLAHGNNEGYWPWAGGIIIDKKKSETAKGLSGIDISMNDVSLAVKMPSGIESTGPVSLTVDEHYMLRAHIVSDGHHPHYRYALFYDGDPENGGELIASKVVRGTIEGDNYVWAEWKSEGTGLHELWVVVLEDSDDPNPGNNTDTLEVEVVEAEAGDSWFQNVIRELE